MHVICLPIYQTVAKVSRAVRLCTGRYSEAAPSFLPFLPRGGFAKLYLGNDKMPFPNFKSA
jgi:hypothetical protein